MSKSFTAQWLGDEDPNSQIIFMGGLRFIKGDEVTVPADNPMADAIKDNPTFKTAGDKSEVVEAKEPDEDEQTNAGEAGTERAALKKELKARGVEVKGNPSVETLRTKLADASKSETEAMNFPVQAPTFGGR